eukprot:1509328-Pyramimonas_sp.AAC.1
MRELANRLETAVACERRACLREKHLAEEAGCAARGPAKLNGRLCRKLRSASSRESERTASRRGCRCV